MRTGGHARPRADHSGAADRQADRFGPGRAARGRRRPARQPPLLTADAAPTLAHLDHLGEAVVGRALKGLDEATIANLRAGLEQIRFNLKHELSLGVRAVSQSSMSSRERSNEPTPLNRAPLTAPRPTEPAPIAPAAPPPPSAPPPSGPAPEMRSDIAAPTPRQRSSLGRFVLLVVVPAVALTLGAMWWLSARPLRLDRQRLCRRRQVADHAAYHRPDRRRPRPRRPARRGRRSAVRPRPRALSDGARRSRKAGWRRPKSSSPICKPSYASNEKQISMGEKSVELRQADYDRKAQSGELQRRHPRRSRHLAGRARPGPADPRVRPQPASDDQDQARRRPRRVDRRLSRLHPGQGAASTTPSAT